MKTAIEQIITKLEKRVIDSTKPDALTKRTGDYRIGLKHAIDECEQSLELEKQFAQQQACAFAEWISNSPYEQDSATNMWDSFCNRSIKLTTEQLYQQFKHETK